MDIPKDRLLELRNQIKMAEAVNREELEPIMVEGIERYVGTHVQKDYGYNWNIIFNEVYPIVQTNLPAIFFRNPKAFLKPRNKTYIAKVLDPEIGRKVDTEMDSQKSANTQEAILNYDIYRMKYKREARKVLVDALLFPHGVLWHGYKGDYGMTEEQSLYIKDEQIFVKRICPSRFIIDPNVNYSNIDEAGWVGRIIDIPYRDLIEDDKLKVNKNMIKGFRGFGTKVGTASENVMQTGGQDSLNVGSVRKSLIDFTDNEFKNSEYSKFIRSYEIYLRPTKKEKRDNKKGYILLLTFEQPEPFRVSEWTVKAEGFPGKILQFNELNDSIFGLADIEPYKMIADQKNIITNLQLRNAQENSKVYVAVAKDGIAGEESIEKIQKGDQTILLFDCEDINGKLSVQSAGGQASSELYLIDQRIQKNLDDKSGVTDLRRGVLQSGEESALSVKLRAGASSARPSYRQDIMADFLKESFYYINQLQKQFLTFDEAVRIIGSLDLQWSEKPTMENIQADVDVEIDAISMLPENPQEELQTLNNILMMLIQGLTQPQIMEKIKQEGKTINISPIIEQILVRSKIKDPEIFRNIKPEESQGYVSVEQLREAKQNVSAALTGQEVPFPPNPQDDHVAKLEIYTTIQGLLAQAGQISDILEQLILTQTALLQEIQAKEASVGQKVDLKG